MAVTDARAKVKQLGLDDVVRLAGIPLDEWDGSCHAVSSALAPAVGGVVRRGIFVGKTMPGALFHTRPAQHSWIELADGTVCDPTRHAFDLSPPFPLWVGPADEYDIGACRTQAPAGAPPDPYDTTAWNGREVGYVELKVESVEYVAGLAGVPGELRYDDAVEVTFKQAAWLANLPVKDHEGAGVLCRFFAGEVFDAICEAGYESLIPIDRLHWICPERA